MASSKSFAELLKNNDGTPFPGLIEHCFADINFAEVLSELERLQKTSINECMLYLANIMPGLPLIADCLASDELLEKKKGLNSALLDKLQPDEPGIEAGVAWQSSCAYHNIFDQLLANSPVLTQRAIVKAKTDATPRGGTAYLFEQLKTTQSDQQVTEWHWLAVVITDDGTRHFLEGVWNLFDIPTANSDVLADYYGEATKKFSRMPAPATPFTRLHGTALGPEDMTLGEIDAHDETYAIRSEKVFGWDRKAQGRPRWHVRHVLEYRDLDPARLGDFIAVTRLIKMSNAKGAPVSTGTHYILNSCVSLLVSTLFSKETDLQNRPLHELMLNLGKKANNIYVSHSRDADVEEFLKEHLTGSQTTFAESNPELYEQELKRTMEMDTLRKSHDGQPPVISCYFTNHEKPANPALVDLLTVAQDLSVEALEAMVDGLAS